MTSCLLRLTMVFFIVLRRWFGAEKTQPPLKYPSLTVFGYYRYLMTRLET